MRGQITIPSQIRKRLGVKDGDKVVFIEDGGRIIMENAANVELRETPPLYERETANRALESAQSDVAAMVENLWREIRQETSSSENE